MPKTRRPKNTRKKSASTTVSIGGTSQSAFAGYATGQPAKPKPPPGDNPDVDKADEADEKDARQKNRKDK